MTTVLPKKIIQMKNKAQKAQRGPKKVEWSEENDKKLRMIKNKLDIKEEDLISKWTSRQLYDKLTSEYDNIGTLEQLMYTMKKFTILHDGNSREIRFWTDKAFYYTGLIQQREDRQELDQREIENWKTLAEIKQLGAEQFDIYQKETKTDVKHTEYNRYLLLEMLTRQPPLRTDFYQTCKFIRRKSDDDGINNFVYLITRGKGHRAYYIVNNDKVTRHIGFKSKENKEIEITDPELVELLFKSADVKPRKNVFETNFGEPYSSIQSVLLAPLNLNFDIARSAFVTDFYRTHDALVDRKELARRMRHDVQTATQKYYKRQNYDDEHVSLESIFSKLSPAEVKYLQERLK